MYSIRLRIRYHQGKMQLGALLLGLVSLVSLGLLAYDRAHATTVSPPSMASTTHGRRQFYLSIVSANGEEATAACAQGYHFASMWEIVDPSNLMYNTSLGKTSRDSGSGPPTQIGRMGSVPAHGWVRTGYYSSTSATAGRGNCDAWSSNDVAHSGTVANLVSDWIDGTQDVDMWNTEVKTCDLSLPVWCVQDDSSMRVLLPLVTKS